MLNRTSILALSAALLTTGAGSAGPLSLVEGGEPAAILVLADEPTGAAREAAGVLRTWIEKMSGARLPLLHESDVAPDPESVLILVGDTGRTRALGIDPEGLGLEEVRVRTFPGAVAVVGDDVRPDGLPLRGTLLAAGLFAREVLGIRWLWPDELGEIVPRRRQITVGEVSIRHTPRFRRRDMFNQAYNGVCHTKIDALGWDHEPFLEMQRRTDEWQARITTAVAAERQRPGAETMARHYSDEAVSRLSAMLDAADRAAAGDAAIRARIGFLRRGLDYAPICRDYMLARDALKGGNKWDWRAYREQSVRRTTWFHQLGPSWSIHVPWLMYREL